MHNGINNNFSFDLNMHLKAITLIYILGFIAILIFADSGTPFCISIFDAMENIPFVDKVLHFLLLGILSLLTNLSFSTKRVSIGYFTFLLGSLIVTVAITLEECSQLFIPHRHFEIMDLLCNYAGILVGGYLSTYFSKS